MPAGVSRSRLYRRSRLDRIRRVHDDAIAGAHAVQYFCLEAVAFANAERAFHRLSVLDDKRPPVIADAVEAADRKLDDVAPLPHDDPDLDAVAVAKPCGMRLVI